MAIKEKRTKAQIAAAAAAGSRNKKKKWAKGKRVERGKLAVFFEDKVFATFENEVPKMRVITPYIVSDKYRVNLSVARAALSQLESNNVLKRITPTAGSKIYVRA